MRVTRPRAFIALLMVTPIAIGAITVARQNAAAPAFDVVSVRINETNERPRSRVNAVPQTGRLTLTGMTVQELKLESRRAPVSVLVIDRLESLVPD
jgi:hypothetical protein